MDFGWGWQAAADRARVARREAERQMRKLRERRVTDETQVQSLERHMPGEGGCTPPRESLSRKNSDQSHAGSAVSVQVRARSYIPCGSTRRPAYRMMRF